MIRNYLPKYQHTALEVRNFFKPRFYETQKCIPNDFLNILFGGEVLKPTLSGFSVLISLVIINFIGFVASVYPVRVALRVQPIRAVQAD